MNGIVEDFSASTLVKANEANMYAFTPFFYDWPGAEKYSGPDLSWCVTGISFPWCNVAFRARLKPEQVDNAIETFIAKGKEKNVPLYWWIGEDTMPANLGDYLAAHGFTQWGDSAIMAIDIHTMNEDVPGPSPLIITQVKDVNGLKIWCHVAVIGYGMPDFAELALLEWFTTGINLKLPLQFYIGWLNGNPVATSLLFSAEGVAGIYFVATVPEARRQGIGFAITLAPLQEARRMGYRVGTLQASKMGVGVYRKIGFMEYRKMGSYIRLNEPRESP